MYVYICINKYNVIDEKKLLHIISFLILIYKIFIKNGYIAVFSITNVIMRGAEKEMNLVARRATTIFSTQI